MTVEYADSQSLIFISSNWLWNPKRAFKGTKINFTNLISLPNFQFNPLDELQKILRVNTFVPLSFDQILKIVLFVLVYIDQLTMPSRQTAFRWIYLGATRFNLYQAKKRKFGFELIPFCTRRTHLKTWRCRFQSDLPNLSTNPLAGNFAAIVGSVTFLSRHLQVCRSYLT